MSRKNRFYKKNYNNQKQAAQHANTKIIDIKGMHCNSCELLIEEEVKQVPGVKSCKVNYSKGRAEISYEGQFDMQGIRAAVEEAGYSLGKDERNFFSHKISDYFSLLMTVLGVFVLYSLAKALGIFELGSKIGGNYNNLPAVFLIGLTAGVSTCMAIVGGLVLGASARFAEKNPQASSLQKFKPHLFFNLGRISSYFILGGAIGYLGSFLQLSTSFMGILTIIVGFVMLLLGLQLTEIIPGLNKIKITLPAQISKIFGIHKQGSKEYSNINSAIMGASTFFLPCGFTQALQLFSISTGSPYLGAITMGTFAIGTVPGLLGIGGLTSVVKGAFARHFFRFAGVVVILLAFFNISNGINLTGFNPGPVLSYTSSAAAQGQQEQKDDPNVTVKDGVQIVKMTQSGSGYEPNSFTIQRGIPVRWEINSTDAYTCAASILVPKFQITKALSAGKNTINFTPDEIGTIKFSCNMGMYTGEFNVIEAQSDVEKQNSQNVVNEQPTPAESPTPTPEPQLSDAQIIKATYSINNDIQPQKFNVKADQPVRLEIAADDDGAGCMGSVMIPGLTDPKGFAKGQTTVLSFTPKKGKYQLTCAMGVPRGEIVAE